MYLGHIVKVLFISEDTGTFKIATCSWKSDAFHFYFFSIVLNSLWENWLIENNANELYVTFSFTSKGKIHREKAPPLPLLIRV